MVDGIQELISALQTDTYETSKTYGAEVSSIDSEGTVWVYLAGSTMETPTVLSSTEVSVGDYVNVEWRNNKLYIAGNVSNPSAGAVRVTAVEQAAQIANQAAQSAVVDAGIARQAAETAHAIVVELEDDVTELGERVDTAESNITTIEGNITALGNRVTTAEGNITTVEGNVTALGNRVTTAEGNITAIEGDISTINGQIDDIESDVSGLTTRVGTAEGKVTTLEGKVSTAETNITNLQGRVSTAESDITAVEGDITTLQGRVADAEDDITDTLNGLALAQDIVGTLNWITNHSTVTADTSPVSGKSYYIKNQDNTFTLVTDTQGKNPHNEGWYELDEAMSNYVASHLALTNNGLCLTNDNNGWKVLVSSGASQQYPAGVYLIDPSGHAAQTTTADGISFDSNRVFTIGNSTAFIVFDPNGNGGQGSITIGGSSIQLGDRTLEDVLGKTLIYDHTYEYVRDSNNKPISASFTAFLYRGGVDVKTEYPTSSFTWYLKKEEKVTGVVTEELIGTGYTCSVNLSDCGYGAEVIGKFTISDDANALSTQGNNLTDVSNNNLSVRSSGDSVRVRDLSTSTTIFPTDKLMLVGTEDEHLVSVQTLQAYLNQNLTKQVLFNTTAAWNAQTLLVSEPETLYVYTDHMTDANNNVIAGLKVGDGNAYLIDLPFTDTVIMEHIADTSIHITSAERLFWNNKVSCYLNSGTETVIFTTQ